MEASSSKIFEQFLACQKSPSTTLIYTLTNSELLTFKEFELIIKSIHGYQVASITPSEETSTITVIVNYHANMSNTRKRLGGAIEAISVDRVNPNIKTEDLQTLQKLRARFGFGINAEGEESETSKPRKKARYATKSKANLQVPSTE